MKTNEVIEGNILLAEFMGENEAHASIGFIYPRDECFPLSGRKFKESDVENEVALEVEEFGATLSVTTSNYNDDWNLLMPVVEKIESFGYDVEIGTTYVRIARSDYSGFGLDGWICAPKIEEVFNACVDFAKWYKNQAV